MADAQSNGAVNSFWKFVAVTAIGVVLGGTPGYISLAFDHHSAVTMDDVDKEITKQNAPVIQRLDDMNEKLNDLKGELGENNRLEQQRDKQRN